MRKQISPLNMSIFTTYSGNDVMCKDEIALMIAGLIHICRILSMSFNLDEAI